MPLDTNQIKPLALREVQKAAKPIPLTRWYGVYPALVRDLTDPEGMGRVKVLLTWAPDAGGTTGIEKGQQYEGWARLATMMAGPNRGSWFIPDINDEVLVSFQGGDPAFPFVVGALWNGQDTPPQSMDSAGENNIKVLKTRSGTQIRFDDQSGQEHIELRTPGGQTIRLSDDQGGSVRLECNGNSLTIGVSDIVLHTGVKVILNGSIVEINSATVNVNSGMSIFSGVVKCETLITKSVVSDSYTPGAGNIW